MSKGTLSLVPILSLALLAGCRLGGGDPEYTESEDAVPAGAIPAAPDVRPGTPSAPAVNQPAVQASGAASPGAIDTAAAAAAPPDTAR